jgi:hypothetical protein
MKRLIIGLTLLTILLVPVSCAKAPTPEEVTPPSETPAPTPPSVSSRDETYKTGGSVPTQDRMIVRTGDMSLVVEDVMQARDEIAQLAARFDGYVVSSQISGEEEDMRGWIAIRVPDEKFETALIELRNLAVRVKSESTNSQDVTEEYTDLEARLKNAEATEKQYLAILDKATDVEDILKVYDYLSRVRQEIEQLKGQMQYLERTSSMSYISVSLEPQASAKPIVHAGWNALETLKSAVRGLIRTGQVLAVLAIWLLIFIPIWGTVLGIILWRRHKRAMRG